MEKYKINKLVRDRIIEILEKQDVEIDYHLLDKNEHIKALKKKLVEESNEVLNTFSKEELIEEISDVIEVIEMLKKLTNISSEDILEKQIEKKQLKGSFEEGHFANFAQLDKDHPLVNFYKKDPEKYPKID